MKLAVTIDITNRCNLKCKFCYYYSQKFPRKRQNAVDFQVVNCGDLHNLKCDGHGADVLCLTQFLIVATLMG